VEIEWFTFPFVAGFFFLLIAVIARAGRWILQIDSAERKKIFVNFFSIATLKSIKESFTEGLLHRKVFKRNKLLGYMHMSLAFGWFLLIVIGHIENGFYKNTLNFPFYKAVFYRYFNTTNEQFFFSNGFTFIMDFLLLFILSGVFLAYYKRFHKKRFGFKRTTKLRLGDKIALLSLWLIFPLRFFAESFTAGIYNNGGFLTQNAGDMFSTLLPLNTLFFPTWLAYSCALGAFLIALPYSRYMHIPMEIVYIFLKNWGIGLNEKTNGLTRIEANACSRCGICIDPCQLNTAGIHHVQTVYAIRTFRESHISDRDLFNCLMCGRCETACPVGIDILKLRTNLRIENTRQYDVSFDYLLEERSEKAKVIYFAGCMTHLTPSIKKSMVNILNHAGEDYWFMDEEKAPCCGRPLMQAGQYEAASKLIASNTQLIMNSGAKELIVSCPICYKVFNEDYRLPGVKVKHHSQYLLELIEAGKLPTKKRAINMVYHDPCDLGRGSNIYEEPRKVIQHYGNLTITENERENAKCCSGSLSNLKISTPQRRMIRDEVMEEFLSYKPDELITACPLCKKTFSAGNELPVKDIAEVVSEAIQTMPRERTKIEELELEEVMY
jgi:Fe-S oxidoreductase